jgi:monofunctional biosynthetic peptidoglycan transglycosylase
MMSQQQLVFDFAGADAVASWRSIDDRIMGGSSLSHPEYITGGGLRFRGMVSLDNGGGFASIRSPETNYVLESRDGLQLRVRGDGKRYRLGLRTDRFFDGICYQAEFHPQADAWVEITLPFSGFAPTHHGQRLSMAAPLDPGAIQSFGLFIAERQAGPFQLDIAWIKAY